MNTGQPQHPSASTEPNAPSQPPHRDPTGTDLAAAPVEDRSAADRPEGEATAAGVTAAGQPVAAAESPAVSPPAAAPDDASPDPGAPAGRRGPLAVRGPLAARGLGVAKPGSPATKPTTPSASQAKRPRAGSGKKHPRPRLLGERGPEPDASPGSTSPNPSPSDAPTPAPSTPDASSPDPSSTSAPSPRPTKVRVPSTRQELSGDLLAELEAELAGADLDTMLSGGAGMPDRREPLAEGARVQGRVLKIHNDGVFVALGGPDEGIIPLEQFTESEPQPGQPVEVMVSGFQAADGLYLLSLPGQAVDVSDWSDLEEGSVVEATVTASNSGGAECTVGAVRGFIPISQLSDVRVEDASDFVGQKLLCVVNEANHRRGNLVLSHRAILERQREEKRREQLEKIEPGDTLEGTVRSVKDFGAFVDLGGLDGLIHISKLSWDRIKHPSEVIQEGQKVKVRVDTIDKQTGKIGLTYRDLLDNPWDGAGDQFAVGTVHRGTVTRVAAFGCFVRLTAGVEGLVHVSELAHHRVSKVDAFIKEGQEVEVKVLSFDRDAQKIGLSIKAAQSLASDARAKSATEEEAEVPAREVAVKPMHAGPLRGGNDRDTGGERFGLRW